MGAFRCHQAYEGSGQHLLASLCVSGLTFKSPVRTYVVLLNFLHTSLHFSGAEAFLESFEPTFSAYLNQTVGEVFPGVGFVAVPLAFEDVWPAVSSATVDFLFLNPSSASCMERQGKSESASFNRLCLVCLRGAFCEPFVPQPS